MTSTHSLKTLQAQIDGMDCGSCAKKIQANLQQLPGVSEVEVNFSTQQLKVSYDLSQVQEGTINERITNLGYTVVQATVKNLQVQIGGMDCGSCAKKIAASLQEIPGVGEASVSFPTGQLNAFYDPLQVNEKAIQDAVTALGYTVDVAPFRDVSTNGETFYAERQTGSPNRMIKFAFRLEGITLIWMAIEATVSIGAGIAAGSLLLIAFGIDSIIEFISASVLFWRLGKEARGEVKDKASIERLERKAGRISGYLLYALSGYVVLQAIYGFTHRNHAETSYLGIAVAVVAALGMPLLAKAKIRVADAIGSKALRADAMETFTCGYLSWVLLAGLVVNALLHWWWLDAAASLVIVPLLVKEAREAMTGECSCD